MVITRHGMGESVFICLGRHNRIPQAAGLNKGSFFSHSPGVWKSDMRVPSWLTAGESPLPHCSGSPGSSRGLPVCMRVARDLSLHLLTLLRDSDFILMISFNLSYLQKAPFLSRV